MRIAFLGNSIQMADQAFVAEIREWMRFNPRAAISKGDGMFALQATAAGLEVAFVNQPAEVPALRETLATLVGAPGRRPDLVLRCGPRLPMSPRRRVEEVIDA